MTYCALYIVEIYGKITKFDWAGFRSPNSCLFQSRALSLLSNYLGISMPYIYRSLHFLNCILYISNSRPITIAVNYTEAIAEKIVSKLDLWPI